MFSNESVQPSNENQIPVTGGLSTNRLSSHSNSNFDDLNDTELCGLARFALNITVQLTQPQQPDFFDNAKIEQIICSGLKLQYDGSPDKLLQTLRTLPPSSLKEMKPLT
jgi:hypothetical protein